MLDSLQKDSEKLVRTELDWNKIILGTSVRRAGLDKREGIKRFRTEYCGRCQGRKTSERGINQVKSCRWQKS